MICFGKDRRKNRRSESQKTNRVYLFIEGRNLMAKGIDKHFACSTLWLLSRGVDDAQYTFEKCKNIAEMLIDKKLWFVQFLTISLICLAGLYF